MTGNQEQHYLAVVNYLKQELVSGRLHEGAYLPAASELSERLHFGERSMADVMSSLATVGVLNCDDLGYQLNSEMGATAADLLCLMLLTNHFRYLDISTLRYVLERAALPAVIQNLTEDIQNDLHTALLHMKAANHPNPSADSHFHRRMIAACGNPLLICMAGAISQTLELQVTAVEQSGLNITWHNLVAIHENLFFCLCNRDLEAANAALKEHYDLLNREITMQKI